MANKFIVVKRDGRKEAFDRKKIVNAIKKAFVQVEGDFSDYAEQKANNIADYVESIAKERELQVEEIQDLIENGLMALKTPHKKVARAFITYRDARTKERSKRSKMMQTIEEKITASNVQNQNANVDERSFGGRKGEMASEVLRQYALENCMSEMAAKNHLNNEIYEHDLDSYALGMHNCLSIPFDDLLRDGFKVRQTDIRPANSINTAFQLVAVIFQCQSLNQFG